MIRLRLLSAALLFSALVLALSSQAGPRVDARTTPAVPARSFEFTYQVHFPPHADLSGTTHLWIPLPQADSFQDIRSLHIDSPVWYSQGRDLEYGNRYALFTPTAKQSAAGFDVTLRFTAVRREHKVSLDSPSLTNISAPSAPEPNLQRYLEPDKLVPLSGTIAELAREHTAGDTTTLEKARHIYDYVLASMRYDKTGEGWGRGDAIWASTAKRGNCTDFHSLFIGMMRSSGIPARFEIGFPLPEGKSQGDITGYHCWAEFYLAGVGWVPVDASEASKNPAKRDFFFGAHDTNRVFFTYGRDIRLSADHKGEPLNYFIYPYAENSGRSVGDLQTHFSFRDVSSAPSASSSR